MKRLYFLLTLSVISLPIGTMHAMSRLSASKHLAPYARQAARSLFASPSINTAQLPKQNLSITPARHAQAITLTMPQQQFVRKSCIESTQQIEIPKCNTHHSKQQEPSWGHRIINFIERYRTSLAAGAALGMSAYALHEQEVVLAEQKSPQEVQNAIKNFKSISSNDPWTLLKIIHNHPEAAQAFVQPAIDNFKTVDSLVLIDIMKKHPEAAQAFMQPALDNLKTVNSLVLKDIMDHHPEAAQAFAQCAIDNLSKINWLVIAIILEHSPEAAETFVQPAIDNFKTVDQWVLIEIIKHYPNAAKAFLQPTVDFLSSNDSLTNLEHLVSEIIKHYPQAEGLLLRYLAKNQHTFSPFTELFEHPTQSKKHLIAELSSKSYQLSSRGNVNYQDHPHLQVMMKEFFALEDAEQQKGRYTFIHGQKWRNHFHQEIYTDLWTIFNHEVSNYRFVRFNKLPCMQSTTDQYDQNCKIFLNYALFTNPQPFDNSAYYIVSNDSFDPPKELEFNYIDSSIDAFELKKYFSQPEIQIIKDRLGELEHEHKTLSTYGSGLLFSMTPELMKQCVYPSFAYGKKRTVNIEGLGETSDPKVILDVLRIAPEKIEALDEIQFVCKLTDDLALKPHNGLDIYEFNAADKEKLAAWRAKKDELMSWIKERVEQAKATAQA